MYGKNSMGMKKAKGMAMGGAVKDNMTVAQARSFLKNKGFKVVKA